MIRAISYNSMEYQKNSIKGLFIFNNVISCDEETLILREINKLQENRLIIRNNIKTRTTTHYGYVFSAKLLKIDFTDSVPKIPKFFNDILNNILEKKIPSLLNWKYNQLTINRYNNKGGIASHVDTHSAFDENIIIISLGSSITMKFQYHDNQVNLWIPNRSLIFMTDEARYLYTHKIPTRKTDIDPNGNIITRISRTSLTFRKINKNIICNCKYPEFCDYQTPKSFHKPDRL